MATTPGFRRSAPVPVPPINIYQAVCIDVVFRGKVHTQFGDQWQYRIWWQLDPSVHDPEGKPFRVRRDYNSSLHPTSTLHKHLAKWFSVPELTKDMIDGFSAPGGPDKLVGLNCRLDITHNVKGDITYANVDTVMPRDPNAPKLALPTDYVRIADRPGYVAPGSEDAVPTIDRDAQEMNAESDCPF